MLSILVISHINMQLICIVFMIILVSHSRISRTIMHAYVDGRPSVDWNVFSYGSCISCCTYLLVDFFVEDIISNPFMHWMVIGPTNLMQLASYDTFEVIFPIEAFIM